MRAFQRLRVLGRARTLQVAWGGVHAQLQVAHMACDQRGVGDCAAAHHAIHVVAHHVHRAVAHAPVQEDDVVDMTMFVVNPEANFATVWSIVPEFWGEAPYPTLTGIGVTWLYGFQFEIKVIAKLPDSAG